MTACIELTGSHLVGSFCLCYNSDTDTALLFYLLTAIGDMVDGRRLYALFLVAFFLTAAFLFGWTGVSMPICIILVVLTLFAAALGFADEDTLHRRKNTN
jgi:fatty acid desaturase